MPYRTTEWKSQYGIAEPFMRSAFGEGLSFSAFYNIALETGISYRRERMLEDWREVMGLYRYEASIAALRPETVIPERYTSVGWRGQQHNYLAGVEYFYTDPLTGERKKEIHIVMSSELQSSETYEHAAWGAYQEGAVYYDPSAVDFHVRWVTYRPAADERARRE